MISLKLWLIVSLSVAFTHAAPEGPSLQHFGQTSPPPVNLKSGYVMKDVVLYLTPSQIKALEATQGLNKVIPFGKPNLNEKSQFSNEDIKKLEAELNRQLEHLRIYEKHNERPIEVKVPPPIEEPNTEKPIPFSPQHQEQQKIPLFKAESELNYFTPSKQELDFKLPESYSYIKFFTDNVAQEKSKVQVFQPFPYDFRLTGELQEQNLEIHKDPIHQKHYKLVPYDYVATKTPEQLKHELVTQVPQWPSLFSQLYTEPTSNEQFSDLVKAQNQELAQSWQKDLEIQKEFTDNRYASKFEDQKNAYDYQKFVSKIEKENAKAKADAFKKIPGAVAQKEEFITKRKPFIPGLKYFNVPEFQPFYVWSTSNPLEAKLRRPYQIPVKVVQAIPTAQAESFGRSKDDLLEVDHYVPTELKKNDQFSFH